MWANETHITDLCLVNKLDHQPVLISTDVEHDAIIAYCIRAIKHADYFVWRLPVLFDDLLKPVTQPSFSVWVRLPKVT